MLQLGIGSRRKMHSEFIVNGWVTDLCDFMMGDQKNNCCLKNQSGKKSETPYSLCTHDFSSILASA